MRTRAKLTLSPFWGDHLACFIIRFPRHPYEVITFTRIPISPQSTFLHHSGRAQMAAGDECWGWPCGTKMKESWSHPQFLLFAFPV